MRALVPILALLITSFVIAGISWALYSGHTLFPADALIIQTHGHNKEIQEAISALHLDMVKTVDTALIRRASFTSSVIWTIGNTLATLIVFLSVTRILKVLLRVKPTGRNTTAGTSPG
jgi:hypothetical protein